MKMKEIVIEKLKCKKKDCKFLDEYNGKFFCKAVFTEKCCLKKGKNER